MHGISEKLETQIAKMARCTNHVEIGDWNDLKPPFGYVPVIQKNHLNFKQSLVVGLVRIPCNSYDCHLLMVGDHRLPLTTEQANSLVVRWYDGDIGGHDVSRDMHCKPSQWSRSFSPYGHPHYICVDVADFMVTVMLADRISMINELEDYLTCIEEIQ